MLYLNVMFSKEHESVINHSRWENWLGDETSDAEFLTYCAPNDMEDVDDLVCQKLSKCKELEDVVRFSVNENTPKISAIISSNQNNANDMEAIHRGESVKAVATEIAVKESKPMFSLKPPPGVPILGTLEIGEFMANGVGPDVFRTRPLEGNFPLWCESCFNLPPYHNPVLPTVPTDIPLSIKNFTNTDIRQYHYFKLFISLSHKDIRRYDLTAAAFVNSTQVNRTHKLRLANRSNHLIVPRSNDFVSVDLIDLVQSLLEVEDNLFERLVGVAMLCILSMSYGAIHLALWNYAFPTPAESILWKVATIEHFAAPVLIVRYSLGFSGSFFKERAERKRKAKGEAAEKEMKKTHLPSIVATLRKAQRLPNSSIFVEPKMVKEVSEAFILGVPSVHDFINITTILLALAFFLLSCAFFLIYGVIIWAVFLSFVLVYLPSRIFIIIESFISLRRVPVGVYADLSWTKYIPHL
jgi:hypothetical protein